MSLPLVIIVVFSLLICMIYIVYHDTYHMGRIRDIERNLRLWYNELDDEDDEDKPDGTSVGGRRNRILRLRERLGIGMDSLPPVRFQAKQSDKSLNNNNDDDEKIRARRYVCLTTGLYLSPQDDYVDCRTHCAVTDGVEYKYVDRIGAIVNGRQTRAGSYCLPTDAALCNTNTSLIVYGKASWRCMPQTRAFAGTGGNRIVVCDGTLLDRATGRIWRDFIDPTLQFSSIDEKLSHGADRADYRFVCPPSRDRLGNKRIESPLDRLIQLDNYCAAMIPHADSTIQPDFRNNTCSCSTLTRPDPESHMCTPYQIGFNNRTYESTIRLDQCVETWSVRSTYPTNDAPLYPCGVARETGSDVAYPSCQKVNAVLFDRVVPSSYALSEHAAAST